MNTVERLLRTLYGRDLAAVDRLPRLDLNETLARSSEKLEKHDLEGARRAALADIAWLEPVWFLLRLGVLGLEGSDPDVDKENHRTCLSRLHSLTARSWMEELAWDRARDHLLKAVAVAPSHPAPRHYWVHLYARMGQYEAARLQLEAIVKHELDGCDLMYQLALAAHSDGAVKEAAECYRRVIALDGVGLFRKLARMQLDLIGSGISLQTAEEEAMPGVARGNEAADGGDLDLALSCYLRVLSTSHPRFALVWVRAGRCLASLAIRLSTASGAGSTMAVPDAFLLVGPGRGQELLLEAAQAARMAISADPALVEAHLLHTRCAMMLGLPEVAIESAGAAWGLAPDAPGVASDLGAVLLARGSIEGAENALRAAVRCHPKDAVAHLRLARALAAAGKEEEAREAWTKARTLDPDLGGTEN